MLWPYVNSCVTTIFIFWALQSEDIILLSAINLQFLRQSNQTSSTAIDWSTLPVQPSSCMLYGEMTHPHKTRSSVAAIIPDIPIIDHCKICAPKEAITKATSKTLFISWKTCVSQMIFQSILSENIVNISPEYNDIKDALILYSACANRRVTLAFVEYILHTFPHQYYMTALIFCP